MSVGGYILCCIDSDIYIYIYICVIILRLTRIEGLEGMRQLEETSTRDIY